MYTIIINYEVKLAHYFRSKQQNRIWNSRTEFETPEQNLKQQNRIWNSKTEFELAEQNLKQQNRIWNSKTEFETAEQNLEPLGKFLFR